MKSNRRFRQPLIAGAPHDLTCALPLLSRTMDRIAVISGKSTIARQFAQILDAPLTHLDAIYYDERSTPSSRSGYWPRTGASSTTPTDPTARWTGSPPTPTGSSGSPTSNQRSHSRWTTNRGPFSILPARLNGKPSQVSSVGAADPAADISTASLLSQHHRWRAHRWTVHSRPMAASMDSFNRLISSLVRYRKDIDSESSIEGRPPRNKPRCAGTGDWPSTMIWI